MGSNATVENDAVILSGEDLEKNSAKEKLKDPAAIRAQKLEETFRVEKQTFFKINHNAIFNKHNQIATMNGLVPSIKSGP